MKNTKHILATIAMLLCSLAASAEAVQIDGIWYNLVSKAKLAEVTSPTDGTKYSGAITIPTTVVYNGERYGVTSIGNKAFSDCSSLTSITIPESVTSIGSSAFSGCSSLTSITIPESVTSIGSYAFYGCESLTSINIPESITKIEHYTFFNCRLRTITIPEGVTEIGDNAFKGCTYLTEVIIEDADAILSFGYNSDRYDNCRGLFYECPLENVYVGRNLSYNSSHGYSPFYKDGRYYNISLGGKMTSIGDYLLFYNKRVVSITIPDGVTSIGEAAFLECSNLTSITIPESVTSIGKSAFSHCSSLSSITIPESVTSIGSQAFQRCSSLTSITIPESVTSIGSSAFYDCTGLTSITIPEGVTSIGSSAFSGCSSLTSISIPEGVSVIGNYVFEGCSSLTSVTIPESVTSIGSSAFYGCTGLSSITIPESVTSIGSSAFYGCTGLSSITIPESVTSIGSQAFQRCSSLTSISIPEGVGVIGNYVFNGCSSLTSITIPEGVTSIGERAFYGCKSLTTIVLPKSLSYIYDEAFANCAELLDMYCYAESVPYVVSDAFNGSYPEWVTLHVPTSAINNYKATAPWSSFGKFEPMSIAVSSITLSQSLATLTEGESLILTTMVAPNNADNQSLSWSSSNPSVATVDNIGTITAIAPGKATITVTANDGSGVSASCEVTVNELILGTCAAPVIDYIDGQVVLTCETKGVTFVSETTASGIARRQVAAFDLAATYTITAYATKEDYLDSETTIVTLFWIDCSEQHADGGDTTNIEIPSRPVLIQTNGGTITVNGLAEGTAVAVFDLGGTQQGTAVAVNGTATITTALTTGSTAVVKIGERSVKVMVR